MTSWIWAGCLAIGLTLPAWGQDAPRRVVSMNLCTDQLAMMLADRDQLVAVSYLARDPHSSVMASEAEHYQINHGLGEEIVRLKPDLVLAGAYTTPATVAMLKRLDIPVAVFQSEDSFEAIRDNLHRMGQLLRRDAQAKALIRQFDADLLSISDAPAARPSAALYYANGYSPSDRSLAGQIIKAAGLHNIAADFGLKDGGILSLEQLILADPDILIRGRTYGGTSRAEAVLDHPALTALVSSTRQTGMADQDWVCGTPHVLRAVARLQALRDHDRPKAKS